MKTALAKTNEELAELRVSLAAVIEEVKNLKNASCSVTASSASTQSEGH